MTEPRVAPGTRRQLGALNWAIAWATGRKNLSGPPNLFLTLGRHRALFRGWLRFARRLMPAGSLARRETELVILRVSNVMGCDYERTHHERIARRSSVTTEEIERVSRGSSATGWSERERAILVATECLLASDDIDDDNFDALHRHLSDTEIIEFVLLVGHYRMLAAAIAALRIQPDDHAAPASAR